MDSVAKGNEFEEECYDIIKSAIEAGELGYIPDQCRLYKKRSYPSSLRNGKVNFDIVIEVWPPNANRYSHICFIECKNYKHSVSVHQVEKFHSQISQVSGVNSKGIFISKGPLQQGAIDFAKNVGLMLMTIDNNESYKIVFHHTDSIRRAQKGKIDYSKMPIEQAIYRAFQKRQLGGALGVTDVKRLSTIEIELVTEQLIEMYDPQILKQNTRLVIDNTFIAYLLKHFGLKVMQSQEGGLDSNNRSILSSYSLRENAIWVHSSLDIKIGRGKFFLAHELGHFFLHRNIRLSQLDYETMCDSQYSFKLDRYLLCNERNWIEWQANTFASFLLMPKRTFYGQMILAKTKIGYHFSSNVKIKVDDEPRSQHEFHMIVESMSKYFNLPKTMIIYRMHSLNLIVFTSRLRPIGDYIKEWVRCIEEFEEENIDGEYENKNAKAAKPWRL